MLAVADPLPEEAIRTQVFTLARGHVRWNLRGRKWHQGAGVREALGRRPGAGILAPRPVRNKKIFFPERAVVRAPVPLRAPGSIASRQLDQAELACASDGLGAIGRAELAQDVAGVLQLPALMRGHHRAVHHAT